MKNCDRSLLSLQSRSFDEYFFSELLFICETIPFMALSIMFMKMPCGFNLVIFLVPISVMCVLETANGGLGIPLSPISTRLDL